MGFVVYPRKLKSRAHDDGAIAILVALMAVVLFGFGALVVDVGNAYNVRQQAQEAVDAASMAGVRLLGDDGGSTDPKVLESTVEAYVSDNIPISTAAWDTCTDDTPLAHPVPDTSCISYQVPSDVRPGAAYEVRVQFPLKKVPTALGGIFGIGAIPVRPLAAAGEGVIAPSPCQPCVPVLDTNGTPVAPPTWPSTAPALPASATISPTNAPLVAPDECPVPGRYLNDGLMTTSCNQLGPGLYVFDNTSLDVTGPLTAPLRPPSDPANAAGVTLVFYGTGTITVEGALTLAATSANQRSANGEIPGVAIVIATDPGQAPGQAPAAVRPFDLGPDFTVQGSIFAIDGDWQTMTPDCPATGPTCHLDATVDMTSGPDDYDGQLAVAQTSFSAAGIPTVKSTNRMAPNPPPDKSPHLVK